MPDWFMARRIARMVAADPARGMLKSEIIAEIGYDAWRDSWGLAYARKMIDFCGEYVVAPARRPPSNPGPKQEARTTCTQDSGRDTLFLGGQETRTDRGESADG